MAKPGRPTKYTEDLADSICERIATSSDGLGKICKELGIGVTTVFAWLDDPEKKQFQKNYIRARELQAEMLAQEIVEIADQAEDITYTDHNGTTRVDNGKVNHQRNRIDARKWIASKLLPKKYGDKLDISMNNQPDGKNPLTDFTNDQLREKLEELKKAQGDGRQSADSDTGG